MSINNTLNAVIAMIEGKPDVARTFFRDPKSDIKDIGAATSRLYTAIDNHTAQEIKKLLVKILSAQPSVNDIPQYEEGFYEGVRAVEKILEDHINKLV